MALYHTLPTLPKYMSAPRSVLLTNGTVAHFPATRQFIVPQATITANPVTQSTVMPSQFTQHTLTHLPGPEIKMIDEPTDIYSKIPAAMNCSTNTITEKTSTANQLDRIMIKRDKWSWCSTVWSVISMMFCASCCGFIGLLCAVHAYVDHKSGDNMGHRYKSKCSCICAGIGIVVGILGIVAIILIFDPEISTIQPVQCPPGYYKDCDCKPCEIGTYQPFIDGKACIPCCVGSTTLSVASKNSTDCVCIEGYYRNDKKVCAPCPKGYYQTQKGQDKCLPCSSGSTTKTNAANDSSMCYSCPAGHYLDMKTKVCEPCNFNTYQTYVGKTECIVCPTGTKTKQTTSTNVNQCITICQCSFNATCVIQGTSSTCNCKSYYNGNGQTCIHQCDSGYCQNGCKCLKQFNGSPYCMGKDGYTGAMCETKIEDGDEWWIICVVIGLLLLLVIIFTTFCWCLFSGTKEIKVCRCSYSHIPCENKKTTIVNEPCSSTVVEQPCTATAPRQPTVHFYQPSSCQPTTWRY